MDIYKSANERKDLGVVYDNIPIFIIFIFLLWVFLLHFEYDGHVAAKLYNTPYCQIHSRLAMDFIRIYLLYRVVKILFF